MLKIGLIGAGHLGKIHLKCIQAAAAELDFVGFYDADPTNAAAVAEASGVRFFTDPAELIAAVDIVDVVTPTPSHYLLVRQALEAGKHVFVEKPLTQTVAEAAELVKLADERGLFVQVGHVERFNPALLALKDTVLRPLFMEAHRLAVFNPRGTDVSVVLDLMIHDLDIVLHLAQSEVTAVHASGVAVVSHTPDIVNARIEFANGGVANLTASRISLKNMRKIRLFQPDAYISLDLLEKETQVVRLYDADRPPTFAEDAQVFPLDTARGPRLIHVDSPDVEPVNAIQLELETFARHIREKRTPAVSIHDGYRALQLAQRISDAVADSAKRAEATLQHSV